MDPYSGFEPQVGEIWALRSFRVGPGGALYPLFHQQAWTDGINTAQCNPRTADGRSARTQPHRAPDPDCTCGFYAYADEPSGAESPYVRHVVAAVTCWGRVIAGTRGVRVEHSRIEAIWFSPRVPADLVAEVTERYPSVTIYADKTALLADHPPTQLDCYEPAQSQWSLLNLPALRIVLAVALIAASLPAGWIAGDVRPYLLGAGCAVALLLAATAALTHRMSPTMRARQLLVAMAVLLWTLAPIADRNGLLLRLPLVQIAVLLYLQRRILERAARQFPASIN
jgi:hypothetical protein